MTGLLVLAPLPSVQQRAKSGFLHRFISGGGGSGTGGVSSELWFSLPKGTWELRVVLLSALPRDSYRAGLPSVFLLRTRGFSKVPLYAVSPQSVP